jgi:hypothetical protein
MSHLLDMLGSGTSFTEEYKEKVINQAHTPQGIVPSRSF